MPESGGCNAGSKTLAVWRGKVEHPLSPIAEEILPFAQLRDFCLLGV